MSGLAAAERLGADYPFPHDPLAAQQVGRAGAWDVSFPILAPWVTLASALPIICGNHLPLCS